MATELTQQSRPQDDLPLLHGAGGILALAALLLGLAATALAVWKAAGSPPSLLAVNLSFCVMLMAALALYRVRGRPGQGPVRAAAIVALLLGLAGPAIFSRQAIVWRQGRAEAELRNVRTIVAACRTWARTHDGHFPRSLGLLAATGNINYNTLKSPYVPRQAVTWPPVNPSVQPEFDVEHLASLVDEASDYIYVGSDLTEAMAGSAEESKLVVVFAKSPRLKTALTVGFADGRAALLPAEEVDRIRAACNAARESFGLPPLQAPNTDTSFAQTAPATLPMAP